MSDPIGEIRGMGPELKAKFEALCIRNTQQFLEHAHKVRQRTELAHKVGTNQHVIKELVNRAELMDYCHQPCDQIHLRECSSYNEHFAHVRSNRRATLVTISGSDFTGANKVLFGSVPANSFKLISDTQITAVSPAGSGTVDV